ncbi:hypothetical protein SO802_009888 [Lithocarpus litseifolius]|uniref:Uncharacterized protein n=1 Tax=Lithocarpus litseifolius TaxID=425828 RepID=A0AAW2DH15_9ROSI
MPASFCRLVSFASSALEAAYAYVSRNRGCHRASNRNTKTYRPLPTIQPEPLGRLCKINNNSCTKYGRIPRYSHSGSPSEDDSHTILARAGEASTGKALYPYNCLPPTFYHPFQISEPRHIQQGSKGISLLHSSVQRNVPLDIQEAVSQSGMSVRKLPLYTPASRKEAGEGEGH